MLNLDKNGIILDQTGDGGDSANRQGLWALFYPRPIKHPLEMFEISPGVLVRHPSQVPWNNSGNLTRDQLIPYVAGCWKIGRHDIVRRVFCSHFKRFFLCQNNERSYPGTGKSLFPKKYKKGERWDDEIFLPCDLTLWHPDGPDVLWPNDIFHLILCGRIWGLYWFGVIGYPFLFLAVCFHAFFNRSNDEGQIISQCKVAGAPFLWLYKRLKKNWKKALRIYWVKERNFEEMFDLISRDIE